MYSLEVHLVDYCNLNCRSCMHFCPLVKDKKHANIDEIIRDLIRLNAIKCTPNVLKLLGGEPLLHPNIIDSLELFRGVVPNSEIIIWTNGLLLPKMNIQFYENCKFFDIKIIVTGYPVKNMTEIQSIVNNYNFIKFDEYFNQHKTFWESPLHEYKTDLPYINYNKCRIKYGRCNILKDGKIYQCALPAYINYLNNYFDCNFILDSRDYVDIYKIQNEIDIINSLYQPTPFCQYCSAECKKNFNWELSKTDSSEWLKK